MVQARLAENRYERRAGTRARNSSLLAGLLVDRDGHRLVASHATRGGRRYRYYQHPATLEIAPDVRIRMPAVELEQIIVNQLVKLLSDPSALTDVFAHQAAKPEQLDGLIQAARSWAEALRSPDSATVDVRR